MCTQLPPYHTSQSPQGRGLLATLRNCRPSARCVTVARWGGLGPPLCSHGRLLLGNLCKFGCGAHHCAAQLRFLRRRCVFAATIQHHFRILPPGLGTLSGTKASQHNHYSIPPKYKYIILPLKCAAFNLSKNSGHKKANFRLINKYSNFPHFTFIVQSISFDFLQTLL